MKNKKIIFITFIAILFLLLLSTSSHAFTISYNVEGYGSTKYGSADEEIADPPEEYLSYLQNGYVVFSSYDTSKYYFLVPTDDAYFYIDNGRLYCSDGTKMLHMTYNFSENAWTGMVYCTDGSVGYSCWQSCACDVYTDINKTDFFFQQPAEQPEGIVQKAVKPVEMRETLAEVVAILPLILSVLVSLIALRKGLQVLLSFLKQS